MRPSVVYEALAASADLSAIGIDESRILELQSIDERPFSNGMWIVVNFEEVDTSSLTNRGPRNTTFWVHQPWDETRDYTGIDKALSAICKALLPLENVTGADGVRVSQVRAQGRSGNMRDDAWKTLSRSQVFGVSYDELAA